MLATCQSTKAQDIQLETQPYIGIVFPYDSAVLIELNKYRSIRMVVQDAPGIIDSLQSTIIELRGLGDFGELIGGSLYEENEYLYQIIDVKDEEIYELSKLNERLLEKAEQAEPRRTNYQKAQKWVLPFMVGVVLGTAISR